MSNLLFPDHDHFIHVDHSDSMRAKFRTERENIIHPDLKGKDVLATSETYNRQAIEAILGADGCAGIRIYHGLADDMKVHLILVGVDANNKDLVSDPAGVGKDGGGNPPPVDNGVRCPPNC